MKLTPIIITILIIMAAAYQLRTKYSQPKDASTLTIGILQTASHPALDAAREGFIDGMKRMSKKVEFIIHNGQGSIAELHSMAHSLHANKNIDALFAIATPASQAMAQAEKEKPIIFAAVSDPNATGIMQPNGNVCGIQDMIDVAGSIDLLVALVPNVKKVALIYSTSEINSNSMGKKMEAVLNARGIENFHAGITSEMEIASAVTSACKNADVLLTPLDNLVASSIPLIVNLAKKANLPLIVSDNELVCQGALAACGTDYFKSGQQAAQLMNRVLTGEKPSKIPVILPTCDTIYVNQTSLNQLGLTMPAFKKNLKIIE